VEVSNSEDNVPKLDALAGKQKKSADDDAEDKGVSSARPIVPNPICSGASEQTDPSATDRVDKVVLPTGGHEHKRPPPATRQNMPLL
jgi:hypothetical protein